MRGTAARWALRGGAAFLFFWSVVYARVLVESRAAFLEGERLLGEYRLEDAVYAHREAAMWYAPLNPFVGKAHERLWQVGRKAELAGDDQLALQAYRAVRSSIMATRSFFTPGAETLRAANERISRLMARAPHSPAFAGRSKEELRKMHYLLLEENDQPDPFWSLLLIAGFFLWIGAVLYFIFRGLDRSLRPVRDHALRGAWMFLVGMAMWIAGMFLA